MNKPARALSLIVLVATLLVAGIAAMPAQLAPPSQPTVIATANAGELQVSWNPVAGAQHYTVGYASPDEMDRMAAAGRNRLDAFTYTTIGAENTSHTITSLEPETVYWVTVGAHTQRFGATDLVWATRHAVATTAGEHGDGFCPITGLPIPAGGYLSVGQTVNWSDATFTLDSAAIIPSITTSTGGIYTSAHGNRYLQLCSTQSNRTGDNLYFSAGVHNNLSTNAGIGFISIFGYGWRDAAPIPNGVTRSACDVWIIPASAATAVFAIFDGEIETETVLYRIDLTAVGHSLTQLPAPSYTTPMSIQTMRQHVEPAVMEIVTATGVGSGFVVRPDGLMVTNQHVVENAQTVTVWMKTTQGWVQLTGTVLGRDANADLAVVQLPKDRTYHALPLADPSQVGILDEVTAWGYPGNVFGHRELTATRGIISSKFHFDGKGIDILQTSAAINSGNSGGPLIDVYGNVVGVNTWSGDFALYEDQGFAVASNEVTARLNTLAGGG